MKDMTPSSTSVLCWPKKLLSADDLRRHLTSQRELVLLPRTVITPLAADELRAKKVRISWQVPTTKDDKAPKQGAWCFAQEKPDAMIRSSIKALERDGISLTPLEISASSASSASWARSIAEAVLTNYIGGIAFCADPATVCCIANKVSGMRAASVLSVAQVMSSQKNLGANLFAIESPGPTFFQVRQMLKAIVADKPTCPDDIAKVLKELDGHAHR